MEELHTEGLATHGDPEPSVDDPRGRGEALVAGSTDSVLAEVFAVLERYPDRRLAAYGSTAEDIQALRARFATWRTDLLES